MIKTAELLGLIDAMEKQGGLGFWRRLGEKIYSNSIKKQFGTLSLTAKDMDNPRFRKAHSFVKKLLQDAESNPGVDAFWSRIDPFDKNYASYTHLGKGILLTGLDAVSPGSAAHEIGHATIPTTWLGKLIHKAYYKRAEDMLLKGKKLPQNFMTDTARLAEEVRASINGYNLLRGHKLPMKQALDTFTGVPTYLGDYLDKYGTKAALGTGAAIGIPLYYKWHALADNGKAIN